MFLCIKFNWNMAEVNCCDRDCVDGKPEISAMLLFTENACLLLTYVVRPSKVILWNREDLSILLF